MFDAKIVVSYNSYLDEYEMPSRTWDTFDSFFEFIEQITAVRELVVAQLKYSVDYHFVMEAKLRVYFKGEHLATENFRREGDQVRTWHNSLSQVASIQALL
jgi:hypothetical protein